MRNAERRDLLNAVMASRGETTSEVDEDLLEAIVAAELASAGDGEAALQAINAAVTAAIARRVGHVSQTDATRRPSDDVTSTRGGREDED